MFVFQVLSIILLCYMRFQYSYTCIQYTSMLEVYAKKSFY